MKKKEHNKIFMLAKSKLNSIQKLISQAWIDLEARHEEHEPIIHEKENYRSLKQNFRNIKSDDELNDKNNKIENNKDITETN